MTLAAAAAATLAAGSCRLRLTVTFEPADGDVSGWVVGGEILTAPASKSSTS